MVNFNLLPYRHYLFIKQKRKFYILQLVMILLAAAFLTFMHLFITFKTFYIKKEIIYLQKKLQPHANIKKLNLAFDLNQWRERLAQILSPKLNQIAGVCFTNISRKNNKIIYVGNVYSINALTTFLVHTNLAQYFLQITVASLNFQPINNYFIFKLIGKSSNDNDTISV